MWKFGIKIVIVEITWNADFFQNICFKERNNMAVGKALRVIINFYKKTVSCSYHMEEKTFIETSCINYINTGEKGFCSCNFWKFVRPFFLERVCIKLWSVRIFLTFLEKKRASKYSLQEANLFFYMYIFSLMCQTVY